MVLPTAAQILTESPQTKYAGEHCSWPATSDQHVVSTVVEDEHMGLHTRYATYRPHLHCIIRAVQAHKDEGVLMGVADVYDRAKGVRCKASSLQHLSNAIPAAQLPADV